MGSSRDVSFVLLLVLMLTVPITGCVEESEYREYVEYRILATSSTPAELLVPQPVCGPVLDRLEVVEGSGEFTTVETTYGPCLKLSFDERIVIEGRWYPDEDPGSKDLMTINLTTMDPNETEPYSWDVKYPHVPSRHAWFNWSVGNDLDFHFRSTMLYRHTTFEFKYSSQQDSIGPGWNEVLVEGWDGEVNAP
jgi:hypothetical protein